MKLLRKKLVTDYKKRMMIFIKHRENILQINPKMRAGLP